MRLYQPSILILLIATLFASCVSTSKYQEALDKGKRLDNQLRSLKYVNTQNESLKENLDSLEITLNGKNSELEALQYKFQGLESQHASLQKSYDQMLDRNTKLLDKAFADKTSLTQELIDKQAELNAKESELSKLEKFLEQKRAQLDLTKKNLAGGQARIDSLNLLLENNAKKLNTIQNQISTILEGYSNDDITVEQRADGRLYISLSQNLLFKKGSDDLDWKGKAAIQKLSKALNSDSSLQINVEGHTDSDGGQNLNWKLSTNRALAVVRVLIDSGVLPQRIIASGRGQFFPLLPNTDEANKSKNRRTEIILSPNLDELRSILKTEQ